MTRILLVEDESTLLRALAMNLTARDYEVSEAPTGTRALALAARGDQDIVVLDLGLPDVGGFEVIKAIRRYSSIPIIVLSARTGSSDKVIALDLGADDYVTKPFNIEELLARLRAAARRAPALEPTRGVRIGDVDIDLDAKTATRACGERVHLTPTEWQLLEILVSQPGKLITRRALLADLRGGNPEHTDPSYLRIYMAQLRRKLEADPSRPRHLVTEPGMGYRYQP
ncbi:MAG TPA: response regulator [Jatrophihabitans sp.]|nr:response regulator [Jatrophihabitans sp.]